MTLWQRFLRLLLGPSEAELARDFVERTAEAELDALWHAFNRRTLGGAP